MLTQPLGIVVADWYAIYSDAARLNVIQSQQQRGKRRLTGATRTNDCSYLTYKNIGQ